MELALLGISLTANQDVTLKCREYECPILLAADKKQAEIKELKKKLMDSKVRSETRLSGETSTKNDRHFRWNLAGETALVPNACRAPRAS